jgi:hypothetical protein
MYVIAISGWQETSALNTRKTQLQVFSATVKVEGTVLVKQMEQVQMNKQQATKEIRNGYMPGRVDIVTSECLKNLWTNFVLIYVCVCTYITCVFMYRDGLKVS